MAKEPPRCLKCGKAHWHFTACEKVDEYRAARERRKNMTASIHQISPPPGTKVFRGTSAGASIHQLPAPPGYKPFGEAA